MVMLCVPTVAALAAVCSIGVHSDRIAARSRD